jgi:hypothetical protein
MKRAFIIVFALLLIGGIAAWLFYWESSASYAQKITGVHFPRGTKVLSNYDSGDAFIVMSLQLPDGKTEVFLRDNGFGDGKAAILLPRFTEQLPADYRNIPRAEKRRALVGRSKTNRWEFIVDPSSSRLWCLVLYPDWAGGTP